MFISRLKRRWRSLAKKDQLEKQLDEELRFHLDRETDQNVKDGMSPQEARYAALRSFSGVDQSKEECRDARGVRMIENLLQDLRFSLRLLIKNPAFTVVAVLTLTLGIGANTAIFSLLDAVLLKSLPVPQPERLVLFGKAQNGGATDSFPDGSWDLFSYPFYQETRKQNKVFSDVASLLSMTWSVHGTVSNNVNNSEPEKLDVQPVSGSYFSTLGLNAGRGRLINDEDDSNPGEHPVAVVSYAWAQQRLGGADDAIGKTITIDQTAYTVVGVAPKEFSGTTVGQAPDLWVPLAMESKLPPGHWNGRSNKSFQSLYLIGRLRESVTTEEATAQVNLLFQQSLQERTGSQPSAQEMQDMQRARIELTPAGKGIGGIRGDFSGPLKILMVIVAVVLLISCANITNLLLARAAARQKEIALRLALGAGRIRLVRQLLMESLLVAGGGGVAGIALAWWGSRLLILMASTGPRSLPLDVTPNARILAFTLFVSCLSALIFGSVPALQATRVDLNASLKDGKGSVQTKSQSPLGKVLVVAQVALSLLLMVGAGLFVRTLINLQQIPTGFKQENVMLFRLDTAPMGYKDAQLSAALGEVEERVKHLPGVEAASFSFFTFNQGGWTSPIFTQDETPPKDEGLVVRQNVVGPDYFQSMGIPITAGRVFGSHDTKTSQKVAVVSEMMAQRFFPNSSALGRRFSKTSEARDQIEIIGVVKDVKYESLTEKPRPMVYFPHSQRPQDFDNFVVRFSGSPETIVPLVRQTVRQVNSNLPVDEVVPLSEHISRSLVQQKLVARLASCFGLLALLLACIGLYGVLSYSVARRSGEIGIRIALGASRANVLKLVLKDGMILTTIGIVLGIGGAFALTRLVTSLLFGVTATDLATFVVVSGVLINVALIACYIPARRAAKLDPLVALRYD